MNNHEHHQLSSEQLAEASVTRKSTYKLALSATLHCLLGCGIGEVLGMIISMWIGLAVLPSIVLSIGLGFVGGFALGVLPWLKSGYRFSQALKAVLVAEGLSIAVMEAAEVATQVAIPGLMMASMTSSFFWIGMSLSLLAGFAAAYPINLWLIRKGVVHKH